MGVSHSAFVVEGDKDKIAKLPMYPRSPNFPSPALPASSTPCDPPRSFLAVATRLSAVSSASYEPSSVTSDPDEDGDDDAKGALRFRPTTSSLANQALAVSLSSYPCDAPDGQRLGVA